MKEMVSKEKKGKANKKKRDGAGTRLPGAFGPGSGIGDQARKQAVLGRRRGVWEDLQSQKLTLESE